MWLRKQAGPRFFQVQKSAIESPALGATARAGPAAVDARRDCERSMAESAYRGGLPIPVRFCPRSACIILSRNCREKARLRSSLTFFAGEVTRISWVWTTSDKVSEDIPSSETAESVGPHLRELVLEWPTGQAEPPFVCSNAQAVELALALATARARLESPVKVSKAVAVQLYALMCDSKLRAACFKNYTIHHVYRALETLSLGRAGGEPPAPEALARLRQLLSRERKDSSLGLLPYLRDRSKHRRRNQMLCDMSYEAAWGRMLPVSYTHLTLPTIYSV